MTTDGRPPTADELPDGWVWANLGEICEPITQLNPRKTMPDERIKYVDISSVDNERNEIVEHKTILGNEAPSRARKPIRDGDVLFATVRTYLRNVAVVPPDYDGEIASTGFCVLRPFDGIQSHFVFRYLLTNEFIQQISEKQRGISYPAVTDRDVYAELVPLAPEAEQKRIVAKIEALFAQSRRGREALDAVPDLLTKFRQAVLAAAFRGALTQRDPADEPASVLLERIRAERRRQWEEDLRAQGKDPSRYKYKEPVPPDTSDLPESPEGWVWARYETLTSFVTSGSRGWAKYYADAGPMFLRVGNLDYNSISLDLSEVVSVNPPEGMEKKRTHIQAGDVLISITGSVGMVAVVPDDFGEAYVNQHIALTRPVEGVVREFVAYYLASQEGAQEQFTEMQYGITKPGLNLTNIRNVCIPLAPLAEKRRIVARIEALFAQADRLEAQVAATRRRLEQVDQAILARAFRGELVEQNPNDEPASVLLTRIKQEQARGAEAREARRVSKTLESAESLRREVKSVKDPSELTDLLTRLQGQSNKPVSPETLWLESKLEIDEFYAFLKQEVVAGHIAERREGREVHLEVTA